MKMQNVAKKDARSGHQRKSVHHCEDGTLMLGQLGERLTDTYEFSLAAKLQTRLLRVVQKFPFQAGGGSDDDQPLAGLAGRYEPTRARRRRATDL